MKSDTKFKHRVISIVAALLTLVNCALLILRKIPIFSGFAFWIFVSTVLIWLLSRVQIITHNIPAESDMLFASALPQKRIYSRLSTMAKGGFVILFCQTFLWVIGITYVFFPCVACQFVNRGNFYFAQNQDALSVANYTLAIMVDPTCAVAYIDRGL